MKNYYNLRFTDEVVEGTQKFKIKGVSKEEINHHSAYSEVKPLLAGSLWCFQHTHKPPTRAARTLPNKMWRQR
jgi:hypothetical protein